MNKHPKKEYISQTFNLRADLVERLDTYRAKHGVTKTFAVEKALEQYLDKMMPADDSQS